MKASAHLYKAHPVEIRLTGPLPKKLATSSKPALRRNSKSTKAESKGQENSKLLSSVIRASESAKKANICIQFVLRNQNSALKNSGVNQIFGE